MQSEQRVPSLSLRIIIFLAVLLSTAVTTIYALSAFSVSATAETKETSNNTDDPAIWIHPTDPALSVVLGTFKNKGVAVYELNGDLLQSVEEYGGMNNVDLRYNFPLGDQKVSLAVATDRNPPRNTLAIFKMDPATRMLANVTAVPSVDSAANPVYGTCMYASPVSGSYYAFITGKEGLVEQWELSDNGAGKVAGTLVRSFNVGSITEGCVADDVFGNFYVAEEDVGIWKYGAEPGDGDTRTAVDAIANGRLTADVEGLSIYYTSDNQGYLLASSQGASEFVIYDRLGDNPYITTFNTADGYGIDPVSETDGIDVTNANLGPLFPEGVFIAHDNDNDLLYSNFKLVPWQDIAGADNPGLQIDTSWNPRLVGLPPLVDFAADKLTGLAPLKVNFSDHSSGIRQSWLWDFGDGGSSTEANPTYTYPEGGLYTVTLTVTNNFGNAELSKADYIFVDSPQLPPVPPTAVFEAENRSGEPPLTVTFTNQSSGEIDTCLWEFGDGQTSDNCANPNHTYEADGSYHVSLTVSNSAGADNETKSDYIIVESPAQSEPPTHLYIPLIQNQP